ncbi:hypothetical protein QT397_14355 [Microbulbifer sp. MKSA007]|nr:hypothetical protein QT397_14355 [Microbulbifer sp. MKSA007]
MIKKIGVITLLLFLASCGSLPFNIPSNYVLNPQSGKGVAVFSVTENCPSNMSIKYRKLGGRSEEAIAINQESALRPAPLQWEFPCGRVIMRELSAGDYEFSSFILVDPIPGVTYIKPRRLPEKKFTIESGRITYAGHLKFTFSDSFATFSLEIENQWERDSEYLHLHAPKVDSSLTIFQVDLEGEVFSGKATGVNIIY